MTGLRVFAARLRGVFQSDARIDEELSQHLEMLTAEYEGAGMSHDAALSAARRDLGPATQIREIYREQRRLPFLDPLLADLRYTARQWRANPAFVLTAILTLALGIGANSAIFQLLDRIVLRGLPVRDPQNLVLLQGYWGDQGQGFSYPLLREMNARQTTVEGIFASGNATIRDIDIDGRTFSVPPPVSLASGNYFRLIGTEPQLGRFFTESEDKPGAAPVAVLSDFFWREEFAAQPSAIGKTIRVNGAVVTIIGIARPEFFGERVGSTPAFWMPINTAAVLGALSPGLLTASSIWLTPMARLRADVPMAQAQAQLGALWSQLREFSMQMIPAPSSYHLALLPGEQGRNALQSQFSKPLWLLMGIAALVVLIACSNLANLLLARATSRSSELSVRLALGAGRTRLIRQLLTESVALAICGGAVGAALASFATRELVTLASAGETWQLSTSFDARIAAFTLLATLACTLIFGLAPALAATRVDLNASLHASRRTHSTGRFQNTAGRVFIVVQISLSLLLVSGASLLVRSFWNITHQELGFNAEHLFLATLTNNGKDFNRFLGPAQNIAVAQRLKQVPGVRDASIAATGFLSFWGVTPGPVSVPDRSSPAADQIRVVPVTPGYLETLGITLLRGRSLDGNDRPNTPHVAVISETAAKQIFGSADPIGKKFAPGSSYDPRWAAEVVGVMRDLRYSSPREPFGGIAFAPLGQIPLGYPPALSIRAIGDASTIIPLLQPAIHEVAPDLKLGRVTPVSELIDQRARQERLLAWLSGAFGAVALLLAAIGLYGVISYAAERRTQELGIRLALGARASQVRALLFKETAFLLATGLLCGGVGTLALSRTLRFLLFDLRPQDPATLSFAVLLLAGVAFLAGSLPARRAAMLDPTIALRSE